MTFRVAGGKVQLGAPGAATNSVTWADFPAGTANLTDRAFTYKLPVNIELLFDPGGNRYEGAVTMMRPAAIAILTEGHYPVETSSAGSMAAFTDTATMKFTPGLLPSPFMAAGVNLVQARSADPTLPSTASVELFYFQIFRKLAGNGPRPAQLIPGANPGSV